jgi:hypothetical protein
MQARLLRLVDADVDGAFWSAPAGAAAPLLERESSLALLNEYAAQAAGGEGRLVLLGGEAGVGKSALVERLHRDLPHARWSWSMCDGLFTPRPLGPLFDLADHFGGALLERCRPETTARSCSVRCWARSARPRRWTWSLSRTSTGPTRPPSICSAI